MFSVVGDLPGDLARIELTAGDVAERGATRTHDRHATPDLSPLRECSTSKLVAVERLDAGKLIIGS